MAPVLVIAKCARVRLKTSASCLLAGVARAVPNLASDIFALAFCFGGVTFLFRFMLYKIIDTTLYGQTVGVGNEALLAIVGDDVHPVVLLVQQVHELVARDGQLVVDARLEVVQHHHRRASTVLLLQPHPHQRVDAGAARDPSRQRRRTWQQEICNL